MEQNEGNYKELFEDTREAWRNWAEKLVLLKEFQKKKEKDINREVRILTKQHSKELNAIAKSISKVNNDLISAFIEEVYNAVFVNKRARTISFAKLKCKSLKDRTLCFGKDGFSYRHEYYCHARPLYCCDFIEYIQDKECRDEIVKVLQDAKQYELAVKVTQFAKLIEDFSGFDVGVTIDLPEDIVLPFSFERYSQKYTDMPRLSKKVELKKGDAESIEFNVIVNNEVLPALSDDEADEDEKKVGVTLYLDVKEDDERSCHSQLLKMQLLQHIPHICTNVEQSIQEFTDAFETLKAEAQKVFGRELLASVV